MDTFASSAPRLFSEPRIEAVSLEVKTSHEQRMTKQVHLVDLDTLTTFWWIFFQWVHDHLLKMLVLIGICPRNSGYRDTPIYGTTGKHDAD